MAKIVAVPAVVAGVSATTRSSILVTHGQVAVARLTPVTLRIALHNPAPMKDQDVSKLKKTGSIWIRFFLASFKSDQAKYSDRPIWRFRRSKLPET